ncbi:MAG TPA: sensor histidine kinase [candidate division Zixibacteria bacterium]|nr:sensor histidine kinase [candidate division Zixibacteria bacterium]
MDPVAEFFTRNITIVYFLYGLAFFTMGVAVWMESNRTSEYRIARAFWLLAGFGIVHGLHEWFEMFQKLSESGAANIPDALLLNEIRIPHLVVSFLLLIVFGVKLLYSTHRRNQNDNRFAYAVAGVLFLIWFVSVLITRWVYDPTQEELLAASDVLSRYILAIPAALLAAWAIVLERKSYLKQGKAGFGRDLQWAAWALIMYGMIGQLFPQESILFPSTIVNSELFLKIFGFPIQFFRATQAALMAFFFIRALRAFEIERQKSLSKAQEEKLKAQEQAMLAQKQTQIQTEKLNIELKGREEMLGELLHQVVSAQEGERRRVARELHDGTGQILTGLGLGLAAASESAKADPELASRQLVELKKLNAQAMQELHNVIGDLRPSVLDNLGLVPALNAQVRDFQSRTGVRAELIVDGKRRRIRADLETIIFRIAQEALTNIAKHAEAQSVLVRLSLKPSCLKLSIEDDGHGFNPEEVLYRNGSNRSAWGLLGIQERVALVGGICSIESEPDKGTRIKATVPLITEEDSDV